MINSCSTTAQGASQTRPPLLNGKYYGYMVDNRIMDNLIGENPNLFSVILDGPTIPDMYTIIHSTLVLYFQKIMLCGLTYKMYIRNYLEFMIQEKTIEE